MKRWLRNRCLDFSNGEAEAGSGVTGIAPALTPALSPGERAGVRVGVILAAIGIDRSCGDR